LQQSKNCLEISKYKYNDETKIITKQYIKQIMKKIAVLYGGYSGEYEISVESGKNVAQSLDKEKFEVFPILISQEKWVYEGENGEYPINKNDFSLNIKGKKIQFDAVFNLIHGTPGEDGKIQGYLDMLKIPYSTSGQATSSLTFHKNFCKRVVDTLKVQVAKSEFIINGQKEIKQRIKQNLKLPLFVKPNNGGSSVGMSKVNEWQHLDEAIRRAFEEDSEVLVEEFIEGREITCAAYSTRGKLHILPITEIVSKKEFFDFEAKYNPSLVNEIVPAPIDRKIWETCENTTAFLYRELHCEGIVRMDYIFNDNGLYFLEVNTIPGMTANSLVPKMIRNAHIELSALLTDLIEEKLP
jgi:D-alanine-D-alanine ligase